MTETINVTQTILNSLSAGEHTLKVEATTTSGFSSSSNATFTTVGVPTISVNSDLGTHQESFSFRYRVSGINGYGLVYAYVDGVKFYQMNYLYDATYICQVKENLLNSLSGGSHTITINLTDEMGLSTTATATFTKIYTVPIVSIATSLGDMKSAFAVPYSIKNVNNEKPSLIAYMDSINASNIIASLNDASTAHSFTVTSDIFSGLSEGSHSIITVVTNTAGSTTKYTSFNAVIQDEDTTALKLGYDDDTWDGTTLSNRIYTESDVVYDGDNYKSFVDATPYDTVGETVTGGLLSAISRGIQNASASNVSVNDSSLVETSSNGTSTLTLTDDGYIEVIADSEGNTITKTVSHNSDGTIAESITYSKGE